MTKSASRLGKRIFLWMLSLIFLNSCSEKQEEEPSGNFYTRAKIGSQLVQFNLSTTSVVESRLFIGFSGDNPGSEYPSYSFGIESTPISVGEYKETDSGIDMVFRYSVSGTEIYSSKIGTETDFVITITSLSSTVVQGTFKGTLRRQSDSNQVLVLSEGEFRLPIG